MMMGRKHKIYIDTSRDGIALEERKDIIIGKIIYGLLL
jgi:hypothetical protein